MENETPQIPAQPKRRYSKAMTAALLALTVGAGATGIAAAQNVESPTLEPAPAVAQTVPAAADDAPAADEGEELLGCDIDFGEIGDLSDEELAEIRAEVAAEMDVLKKAFDDAGIAYTEVADEFLGVPVIEWDFEDEAANEVADTVFSDLYGDIDFGDLDLGDLQPASSEA